MPDPSFKNPGILSATRNALNGARELAREKSARREIALALVCCVILYLDTNAYTLALLVLALLLLALESLNTALEEICDHVTPEYHLRIKKIKDLGGASIFITILAILVVVAAYVLSPANGPALAQQKLTAAWAAVRFDHSQYIFYSGALYLSLHFWKSDNKRAAIGCVALSSLWLLYQPSVSNFLTSLGSDSFHELSDFDRDEALFFLSTLPETLKLRTTFQQYLIHTVLSTAIVAAALGIVGLLISNGRRVRGIMLALSIIGIVYSLHTVVLKTLQHYVEDGRSAELLSRNFSSLAHSSSSPTRPVDLIVYIGESTSAMNMSLYGYQRSTTPRLDVMKRQKAGVVVFENVFSTHTHTSPSLLEALSVGPASTDDSLPIHRRQRVSIVDILNDAGFKTHLVSNQGTTGAWNQASAVIFKNAERSYSLKSGLLGNNEYILKRPWDHEFLARGLSERTSLSNGESPKAIFLHSYAGHGPYRHNIPEGFRIKLDDRFSSRAESLEITPKILSEIDDYDAAMRYVDFSVSTIAGMVEKARRPTVLIYFSDHGESPFTGHGHDSSRASHEMLRVPLVIYFNEAFVAEHAEVYQRYRARAGIQKYSTLAELPYLMLDISGTTASINGTRLDGRHVDAAVSSQRLLVREAGAGVSYFRLGVARDAGRMADPSVRDTTDAATSFFNAISANDALAERACLLSGATVSDIARATFVARCVHIDVRDQSGGSDRVLAVSRTLEALAALNTLPQTTVWLSGLKVSDQKDCARLLTELGGTRSHRARLIVDFLVAEENLDLLSECTRSTAAAGHHVSFTLPPILTHDCSTKLAEAYLFDDVRECRLARKLMRDLRQKVDATDLTVDPKGLAAAATMAAEGGLRLSLVGAAVADTVDSARFARVAMAGSTP